MTGERLRTFLVSAIESIKNVDNEFARGMLTGYQLMLEWLDDVEREDV
jgi:hypothetical protein